MADSCLTGYVAEAFQQRFRSRSPHCLPNVDLEESLFSVHRAPPPTPPFKLVSVGLAADYKGQHVLLEALSKVNFPFHLTVAGSGRADGPVRAQLERLGLKHRVSLVGRLPRQDLFRLFDGADLLVAPSLAEGLPRAPLEAMARGLPCLGARVGDMDKLLPEWALTRPGDSHALARLLQEVHDHPEKSLSD